MRRALRFMIFIFIEIPPRTSTSFPSDATISYAGRQRGVISHEATYSTIKTSPRLFSQSDESAFAYMSRLEQLRRGSLKKKKRGKLAESACFVGECTVL